MSQTTPLSAHFSWAEARKTDASIPNTIPQALEANVRRAAYMMESIRSELGGALIVNSWFRSLALNTAVGGSKTSAHLSGLAVDFRPTTVSLKVAYERIKQANIPMDQLILESVNGIPTWIHVGFAVSRNEYLLANKVNGVTTYTRYPGT